MAQVLSPTVRLNCRLWQWQGFQESGWPLSHSCALVAALKDPSFAGDFSKFLAIDFSFIVNLLGLRVV